MPNPHYQRVLEQDKALPAPLRWLTRAMSSWWTIGLLSIFVVGYVAAAHIPLGGRYVWQWRIFDTTQHAVLTWWPLLAAAWLLAAVILWSAMRRLPWRIDNLGAFVAVIGLVMILLSQSWAFHSQSVGVAAVPVSPSTGSAPADALSLNYTTRYGDTHDRVLLVMVSGAAPITIPLDDLPRWNDATGDACPKIKLHDDPKLSAAIGFGTRITTAAYLADGTLTENEDGTQTATPTPANERDLTALPYPAHAHLALNITTDTEDGSTKTTTAWLPFEPEGTDALVPKHFFPIEGLGSIGLAFRPASKKMPFALAGVQTLQKRETILVADSDTRGKLLQPLQFTFDPGPWPSFNYVAKDLNSVAKNFKAERLGYANYSRSLQVQISASSNIPFTLAGLITFILGVILEFAISSVGPKPERNSAQTEPKNA